MEPCTSNPKPEHMSKLTDAQGNPLPVSISIGFDASGAVYFEFSREVKSFKFDPSSASAICRQIRKAAYHAERAKRDPFTDPRKLN